MGGAEFIMLGGGVGGGAAINMAAVREVSMMLGSGSGPEICLTWLNGDEVELGGDDAICVLKWLREHAGRHPHLSLDLDDAAWRGGGGG